MIERLALMMDESNSYGESAKRLYFAQVFRTPIIVAAICVIPTIFPRSELHSVTYGSCCFSLRLCNALFNLFSLSSAYYPTNLK
jgi:hypothetical protein